MTTVGDAILNKAGMCGKSISYSHEPTFFCFSLLKSKPTWLPPEELRFEEEEEKREGGRESMQMETLFCSFCTFSDQLRLRFDVAATSSVYVISGRKREDVGGRGRGEGVGRRGCYKLKKKRQNKHVVIIKEQNTFETEF